MIGRSFHHNATRRHQSTPTSYVCTATFNEILSSSPPVDSSHAIQRLVLVVKHHPQLIGPIFVDTHGRSTLQTETQSNQCAYR
jgi:hypothetical protein